MYSNGVKQRKLTTRGWDLLEEWKDGSTDWLAQKDYEKTYPIEFEEYTVKHDLQEEPVFAWCIPYVLKKRDRILKKVKLKYWTRTHQYGLLIPKSIKDAIEIDEVNGNTLWMDSIKMEVKNVRVAFEDFDGDTSPLVDYTQITGHLVFDLNFGDDFRRKARVLCGYTQDWDISICYEQHGGFS